MELSSNIYLLLDNLRINSHVAKQILHNDHIQTCGLNSALRLWKYGAKLTCIYPFQQNFSHKPIHQSSASHKVKTTVHSTCNTQKKNKFKKFSNQKVFDNFRPVSSRRDGKHRLFLYLAKRTYVFVKQHFSNVSRAPQKLQSEWAVGVLVLCVRRHRHNALMCTREVFYYTQLYCSSLL